MTLVCREHDHWYDTLESGRGGHRLEALGEHLLDSLHLCRPPAVHAAVQYTLEGDMALGGAGGAVYAAFASASSEY